MKLLLATAAAALLSTAAHAQSTSPSAIIRHPGGATSPILAGVTVPAGKTTYYLSGMLADPIDPAKPGSTVEAYGDTRTQTISIFNKMKAMLQGMGLSMADIVKLTVFVTADPKSAEGRMDFAGFNEGYKQFFGTPEQPNKVARSTVQVAGLAAPMFLIEIEAIAAK